MYRPGRESTKLDAGGKDVVLPDQVAIQPVGPGVSLEAIHLNSLEQIRPTEVDPVGAAGRRGDFPFKGGIGEARFHHRIQELAFRRTAGGAKSIVERQCLLQLSHPPHTSSSLLIEQVADSVHGRAAEAQGGVDAFGENGWRNLGCDVEQRAFYRCNRQSTDDQGFDLAPGSVQDHLCRSGAWS